MPAIPFTLKLRGLLIKTWKKSNFELEQLEQDELKTVVNKATNEQLSVSLNDGIVVEIKRTRAPMEKKKNSQNS